MLLNEQFVKTQIEEYDYDSANRLAAIRFQARSEFNNSWQESVQEFHYDDQNRVSKTVYPGFSEERYFYDENGNVNKIENYLIGAEYDGPLTITYTYDTKKNPYYLRPEYRTGGVKLLSPNNVIGWESISPETDEAIAAATVTYEYNAEDYPIRFTQTVLSPLTDLQPALEVSETDFEYVQ